MADLEDRHVRQTCFTLNLLWNIQVIFWHFIIIIGVDISIMTVVVVTVVIILLHYRYQMLCISCKSHIMPVDWLKIRDKKIIFMYVHSTFRHAVSQFLTF